MKKYILALAALLGVTTLAFNEVDKQQGFLQNLLVNPGFENSKIGWVDTSSSTFSILSGAGNSLYGNNSAVWNGTTAGQSLRSSLYTLSQGLYGKPCLGQVAYKGGASTLTAEVLDANNSTLGSQVLTAVTGTVNVGIPFQCPTSGGVKIGIKTNATNSTSVILDNFYLGEDKTIGTVSQPQIVGRLFHSKTASCTWTLTDTSGNLADFPTTAACPGPSIEYAGASGNWQWQTTDTDLPQITVNNLPAGDYLVKVSASFAASSGTLRVALSDGTTNSGETAPQQTSNVVGIPQVLMGYFNYTTTGNRTFRIRGSELVSSQIQIMAATAASAGNGNLVWEVVRMPQSSDMVARPDATPASWSGYHSNDCGGASWVTTSNTYTDLGDDASCTFAELTNRNFGTVTTLGASKPGLSFTPPRVGRYLITAVANVTSNVAGNYVSTKLVDDSGSELATAVTLLNNSTSTHTMSGIMNVASIAAKSVKIQIAGVGGSNYNIGTTGGVGIANARSISWSIVELDAPMPTPFLTGFVRSAYPGVVNTEWARVSSAACSSSPCTLNDNSDGISSVTRTGAGAYQINFASGSFTTAPTCNVSAGVSSSSNIGVFGVGNSVNSTSAVNFSCILADGVHSATDCGFQIQCVGKR